MFEKSKNKTSRAKKIEEEKYFISGKTNFSNKSFS